MTTGTQHRSRARLGQIEFEEGFASWDEAQAAASGYDAPAILDKARDALLKVKRGEAAYERDTVLFDRIEFAHPVIAGLLEVALERGNRLSVLDFGGSLGSSYFQSRPYLDRLEALTWCIVEQPHFVACGRAHFESGQLRFYASVEACVAEQAPDVVLLSGVLEYLEAPLRFLAELAARRLPYLLIDRTLVMAAGASRVTVQHVPPSIYPASYPCWFINRAELLAPLLPGYELIDEFFSTTGSTVRLGDASAEFRGFFLRRRGG